MYNPYEGAENAARRRCRVSVGLTVKALAIGRVVRLNSDTGQGQAVTAQVGPLDQLTRYLGKLVQKQA